MLLNFLFSTRQRFYKIERLVCGCHARTYISGMHANKRYIAGARGYYQRRVSFPLFCDVADTFNLHETVNNVMEKERRCGRLYQSLVWKENAEREQPFSVA